MLYIGVLRNFLLFKHLTSSPMSHTPLFFIIWVWLTRFVRGSILPLIRKSMSQIGHRLHGGNRDFEGVCDISPYLGEF